MHSSSAKLYPLEWLIVSIFCLILLSLTFYGWINRDQEYLPEYEPGTYSVTSLITVAIEGEVVTPGVYQVKRGTKIKDVIEMAVLKENGDISSIKVNTKVRSKQKIKIPAKKTSTKRKRLRNNS